MVALRHAAELRFSRREAVRTVRACSRAMRVQPVLQQFYRSNLVYDGTLGLGAA
jgi:hypothetical protein